MKSLKRISSLIVMLLFMASFSQCSTAQKLQKKAPFELGEVYAQEWVAGIKGGGSGINVFIPVSDTSISLDSMFFRRQKVKLEFINGNQMQYVGRFSTEFNEPNDIILSSDMKEESKNKVPKLKKEMPFEINDDECIITYKKGDKTMYYKISNIIIKKLHYPSASPNGQ